MSSRKSLFEGRSPEEFDSFDAEMNRANISRQASLKPNAHEAPNAFLQLLWHGCAPQQDPHLLLDAIVKSPEMQRFLSEAELGFFPSYMPQFFIDRAMEACSMSGEKQQHALKVIRDSLGSIFAAAERRGRLGSGPDEPERTVIFSSAATAAATAAAAAAAAALGPEQLRAELACSVMRRQQTYLQDASTGEQRQAATRAVQAAQREADQAAADLQSLRLQAAGGQPSQPAASSAVSSDFAKQPHYPLQVGAEQISPATAVGKLVLCLFRMLYKAPTVERMRDWAALATPGSQGSLTITSWAGKVRQL